MLLQGMGINPYKTMDGFGEMKTAAGNHSVFYNDLPYSEAKIVKKFKVLGGGGQIRPHSFISQYKSHYIELITEKTIQEPVNTYLYIFPPLFFLVIKAI